MVAAGSIPEPTAASTALRSLLDLADRSENTCTSFSASFSALAAYSLCSWSTDFPDTSTSIMPLCDVVTFCEPFSGGNTINRTVRLDDIGRPPTGVSAGGDNLATISSGGLPTVSTGRLTVSMDTDLPRTLRFGRCGIE